jgi:hypothetical protein
VKLLALAFGAAAAAAFTLPSEASADGAGPAPSLHLRYTVNVGVKTTVDVTKFSGNERTDTGDITASGTIDADVVGVTAGGGSVVLISESTGKRNGPPVRLTVTDQGEVTFDAKDASNLNEEELALARLFGRAVVASHDLKPDANWQLARQMTHSSESTTFRVVSLAGDRVNLEIDRVAKGTGAQPFDISGHGKVLYDYKREIPISGETAERIHSLATDPWEINARATTDLSFEFRLTEDSLTPK